MSELARAGLLALGFVGILVAAEVWYRLRDPPVEATRKLVHLASGLPVLAFPWIFESPWTVLLLSASIAGVLAVGRRMEILESVCGVTRESRGEILYPVGIVLLFWVAQGQPVLYFTAVLVLIVADPAAALIGLRYGRIRYDVEDHWRSLEGSVGFFLMTFVAVLLPLLLMAELDPGLSVLVSLVVAIFVTLFEAISLRGADNVAVPLATFLLLEHLTDAPAATVALNLGVLVATLVVLTGLSRWVHFMKASGVLAATIFFYVVFALAGPAWVLPPALGMLTLAAFRGVLVDVVPLPDARYQVVAIFYATVPTLVLVLGVHLPELGLIAGWPDRPEVWAAALAGAVAGQAGVMCATQLDPFNPERPRRMPLGRLLVLTAGTLAVVGPPSLLVTGSVTLEGGVLAAAVGLTGGAAYWFARAATSWPAAPPWNFRLQAAAMTTAGLAAVALATSLGG